MTTIIRNTKVPTSTTGLFAGLLNMFRAKPAKAERTRKPWQYGQPNYERPVFRNRLLWDSEHKGTYKFREHGKLS